MKTLLQINTSIFSDGGQSSRLAERFVAAWREANPEGTVVVRDLAKDPVPHIDAGRFGAFLAKPGERTSEQQRVVDYSDALIDELKRADVVVLGLPMYNFGVPSTLKAYFDHVARAGVTFRYTETGPVGLLKGKKVYVFAARGGRVCRNAARHANPVRARFPRFPRDGRRRVRLRRRAGRQRGHTAAGDRWGRGSHRSAGQVGCGGGDRLIGGWPVSLPLPRGRARVGGATHGCIVMHGASPPSQPSPSRGGRGPPLCAWALQACFPPPSEGEG